MFSSAFLFSRENNGKWFLKLVLFYFILSKNIGTVTVFVQGYNFKGLLRVNVAILLLSYCSFLIL